MPKPKPGDLFYDRELDRTGVFNGIFNESRETGRMLVVFGEGKPYLSDQVVVSGGSPAKLIPVKELKFIGKRNQNFTGPDPQVRIVNLFERQTTREDSSCQNCSVQNAENQITT